MFEDINDSENTEEKKFIELFKAKARQILDEHGLKAEIHTTGFVVHDASTHEKTTYYLLLLSKGGVMFDDCIGVAFEDGFPDDLEDQLLYLYKSTEEEYEAKYN